MVPRAGETGLSIELPTSNYSTGVGGSISKIGFPNELPDTVLRRFFRSSVVFMSCLLPGGI